MHAAATPTVANVRVQVSYSAARQGQVRNRPGGLLLETLLALPDLAGICRLTTRLRCSAFRFLCWLSMQALALVFTAFSCLAQAAAALSLSPWDLFYGVVGAPSAAINMIAWKSGCTAVLGSTIAHCNQHNCAAYVIPQADSSL